MTLEEIMKDSKIEPLLCEDKDLATMLLDLAFQFTEEDKKCTDERFCDSCGTSTCEMGYSPAYIGRITYTAAQRLLTLNKVEDGLLIVFNSIKEQLDSLEERKT